MKNDIPFRATKSSKEVDEKMIFIKKALNHRKKKKIITHPLVAAYLHIKWQSLKLVFYGQWLFFILAVLIPLTLMTALMVEMNQCHNFPEKNQ